MTEFCREDFVDGCADGDADEREEARPFFGCDEHEGACESLGERLAELARGVFADSEIDDCLDVGVFFCVVCVLEACASQQESDFPLSWVGDVIAGEMCEREGHFELELEGEEGIDGACAEHGEDGAKPGNEAGERAGSAACGAKVRVVHDDELGSSILAVFDF